MEWKVCWLALAGVGTYRPLAFCFGLISMKKKMVKYFYALYLIKYQTITKVGTRNIYLPLDIIIHSSYIRNHRQVNC